MPTMLLILTLTWSPETISKTLKTVSKLTTSNSSLEAKKDSIVYIQQMRPEGPPIMVANHFAQDPMLPSCQFKLFKMVVQIRSNFASKCSTGFESLSNYEAHALQLSCCSHVQHMSNMNCLDTWYVWDIAHVMSHFCITFLCLDTMEARHEEACLASKHVPRHWCLAMSYTKIINS